MGGALIFHGAMVLLIGLLAGAPYGRAIAREAATRRIEAWRVAHSGLIGTGVMTLVFGLALRGWSAAGALADATAAAAVVAAYAFSIAMIVAALSGQRGLNMRRPAANRIVFTGYAVGVLGSLAAASGFVLLAWIYWKA